MRMWMAVVFLVAPSVAVAQYPGSVRGRVVDSVSTIPVAGAEVTVANASVRTNVDGRFSVKGIPPGQYDMLVRAPGYSARHTTLQVINGEIAEFDILLRPLPVQLRAVEVRGEEWAGYPRLSSEEIKRRGATLAEALDGWAGIAVRRQSNGPAVPLVRGGAPDEVMVIVDGQVINDPGTGIADLTRISTRAIESLTLYQGAQTARFGRRALAGAIVIQTRSMRRNSLQAWTGSHGRAGGDVTIGFDQTGWLRAEYERSGDRYPVTLPVTRGGGESTRRNAGYDLIGLSARSGLLGAELKFRGRYERRGLPGTVSNPSTTAAGTTVWTELGVVRRLGGPNLRINTSLLRTVNDDPSPPSGRAYFDTTWVGGVDVEATWSFLAGGFQVDHFSGNTVRQGTFTVTRGHISLGHRFEPGPIAGFWFSPSLRLDAWSTSGSPALSARLESGERIGEIAFFLAAGSSTAPPVVSDLTFREGVGVRPNPDLRPQRIPIEVEGAVTWNRAWGLLTSSISARGFAGRIDDMVLWAPDFRFVWSPDNFDANRSGFELNARLVFDRLGLTVAGSLGRANVTYDRPNGPQVIYRPRSTESFIAEFHAQPFRLRLNWRRLGSRFPNHGGANALSPVSTLSAAVSLDAVNNKIPVGLELELSDLTDRRAQFIAGYPSPGRSLTIRVKWEEN